MSLQKSTPDAIMYAKLRPDDDTPSRPPSPTTVLPYTPHRRTRGCDPHYPLFGTSSASQIINLHKALCPFVCILFMAVYNNWSLPAVLYTVMHSCYAISWLIMDIYFPPKNFHNTGTTQELIGLWISLTTYWVHPLIVCSTVTIPNTLTCACALVSYIFGLFCTFVASAQLYYTLGNIDKPRLIDEGLFTYSRNPTYVGEVLIYSGFALMGHGNIKPWIVNLLFWTTLFRQSATKKDKSLSRHQGWDQYVKRSGQFFPGF